MKWSWGIILLFFFFFSYVTRVCFMIKERPQHGSYRSTRVDDHVDRQIFVLYFKQQHGRPAVGWKSPDAKRGKFAFLLRGSGVWGWRAPWRPCFSSFVNGCRLGCRRAAFMPRKEPSSSEQVLIVDHI
ncbi:hypothetical protein B0T09DRAFT_78113 [Sordaria sp. MPI-SDFR-AT-0083]|nr:hypothetical protein B0T09DRAFT_78113 [Sordaria sp. MPI-SDFR-AT-0083]